MPEGTPDTGRGATPESHQQAPGPSPEMQALVGALGGQTPVAEGPGDQATPQGDGQPPLFQGRHRVALQGGQRVVEVDEKRIAELIEQSEKRGKLEEAEQLLEQRLQQNAVYKALDQALGSMPAARRDAWLKAVLQNPDAIDRLTGDGNGSSEPPSEEDEMARLLDGTPPRQQQSGQPDPRVDKLTEIVQALLNAEVQREQTQTQSRLHEVVDRAIAEWTPLKSNQAMADLARRAVMAEVAGRPDAFDRVGDIVAEIAGGLVQAQQEDRAQLLGQNGRAAPPVGTTAPQAPKFSAADLRNGNLKRAAMQELRRQFAAGS